jgi:hypothetical protein
MFVGSQYSNDVQEMWIEQEAEYQEHLCEYKEHLCKWEDLELEFEHEELERECRECEELTLKLPPVPTDTPFPPSPTYKTTIGH